MHKPQVITKSINPGSKVVVLTSSSSNIPRRLLTTSPFSLPPKSSSSSSFHHLRGRRSRRRRRGGVVVGSVDMSRFEGGDLDVLYFNSGDDEKEEEKYLGEVQRGKKELYYKTVPDKRKKRRLFIATRYRSSLPPGNIRTIERLLLFSSLHWDFNAFTLDRLSQGDGLASLCTYLFHRHGLLAYFQLDPLIVWKFFSLVEAGYRASNPYHNATHATDVTQAMNIFLQEPLIKRSLTPLELMSALIAAATHDLDHPGRNEKFLVATGSHLAALYYEPESGSLLENHHWRSALSLMHESGFAETLSSSQLVEITDLIKSAILATDIAKQGEYLTKFTKGINEGEFNSLAEVLNKPSRTFIVQIAMKCADISNPCRAWNISRLWSYRASEEFFRQGDKERELGLSVTPPFDRLTMTVAKIQTGFYRMVASPLFEEWNRFLGSSLSNVMLHNLTTNHARWDLIIQQETSSVPDSLMSTSSSSSSSSQIPTNLRRSSFEPFHHSDDGEEEDEDDTSDRSYPYLPLDSSSNLNIRRRFSLPLTPTPSDDVFSNIGTPLLRCGHKRRLFAASAADEGTSDVSSSSHRVTFHLGNSLDETSTLNDEERIIEEEEGPNKVPKIFEEDKENSRVLYGAGFAVRRGSAPSDLLLNQIASSKKKNSSSNPGNKQQRDVSPGSIINSSKDPIIVRVNHQRHSRLHKIDRRRGSLPVFSPADFIRIEEELLTRSKSSNVSDSPLKSIISSSNPSASCSIHNQHSVYHHPKLSPSCFSSCSSSSTSSSSFSSKRTSSSSLVINTTSQTNTPSSSSGGGSFSKERRKILRRKSGGSETLLSSSQFSLEKSFLRRGSLRLGDVHLHSHHHAYGHAHTSHHRHRHIVVSQETLLDELIKFSNPSSSSSAIPSRVQILRGLSPAIESELLQKFRTNLALNNNNTSPGVGGSGGSGGAAKRPPLTSYSSNKNSGKGRRGSLPTELLSFV
ncbi:uncharacterized protein [Lepeophtheirus salmonis]|uniref:uncharacterized protein n=1 Tax=Lepeophtheirus salmonis TaxID=72036 RepID=UPI001AE6B29A|nr:uncharacterized protein LOC121114820 [Lepeophtheirus salmonis]XP_040564843.1 uncharacterized protein LOC121114820 [Lepeophtheirus salmonis]